MPEEEKIDEETARQIQEMQILEQNLQNLLFQKQAFQIESSEIENALEEIKKAKQDTYKIIGQVMIKTEKKELQDDLKHKKELINLRMTAIEKQENYLKNQLQKKRDEIMSKLQPEKSKEKK